jgi:hypothetical protein
MLIAALIILGIGFLKNIMNMLLDVFYSFKKIWLLDHAQSHHGRTLHVQLQWEEPHERGKMVGTPSTPKMGYVQ